MSFGIPGSSSSRQVLEFMSVRSRRGGIGSVGDSGGEASKVVEVGVCRTGGEGKWFRDLDALRLVVCCSVR